MAAFIYFLCALACAACFVMLMKAYIENRHRVLFWSALAFGGLTLNNVLLVADRVTLQTVYLSNPRLMTALVSILVLVFGLIWEEE